VRRHRRARELDEHGCAARATPEEGHELTRIEERINRLLKRDEIKDFEAVGRRTPVGVGAEGENGDGPPAGPAPPPPPASAMKRSPRKYRKAL